MKGVEGMNTSVRSYQINNSFKVNRWTRIPVLVFFFLLCLPLPSHTSDYWNIETVEKQLLSSSGIMSLVKKFHTEQDELKQQNRELYYYVEGITHMMNNDFKKAESSFTTAIDFSKETSNIDIHIASLNMLNMFSDFYVDSGALIEYGSQLLELSGDHPKVETKLLAYNAISISYYYVANDQKALEYLETMLYYAKKQNNQEFQGIYHLIKGHMHFSYFDFESAVAHYEEAARYLQEGASNPLANLKLTNQGSILLAQSKLPNNKEEQDLILKKMNTLIKETEKQYYPTVTLFYLYLMRGQIEQEFQLNEEAVHSFESSIQQMEQINHLDKYNSQLKYAESLLARAYFNNGDDRKAAALFISIIDSNLTPEYYQTIEENTNKINHFSEKELQERINLLTELQDAQDKRIRYQHTTIILTSLTIAVLIGSVIFITMENKKVTKLKNNLYTQSVTDSLTGVYNRKRIFELLETEDTENTIVALIDIDNFKMVNDTFGYLVGDEVLKKVVATMKAAIGKNDVIGRYGGEEFIIIMNDTPLKDGLNLAEKIRKKVETLKWEYDHLQTTISIGVAEKASKDTEDVFKEVTHYVHYAKKHGKNRIAHEGNTFEA